MSLPWLWRMPRDPRPGFGWRAWQIAIVVLAFALTVLLTV